MKSREFLSICYINASYAYLLTFFEINGFKNGKQLEVERYHQPSRYRKKSEYIPTSEETWRMVDSAGTPKNRAIIACLYSSGLRNSTLRALRYKDVKGEAGSGI